MNAKIAAYLAERVAECERLPVGRRRRLDRLAGHVRQRRSAGLSARLTFICTHNSRRSHMAQLWAWTAAAFHGIEGVETFSGGTEATAFNRRAVAALVRAGFDISPVTTGENPVYEVRFGPAEPTMRAFSKIYHEEPNPAEDFCAVMTCAQADESCPLVRGAAERVAIPYEDPKAFDGTERETAAYDERCRQIAREMLYVFACVGSS